ncbi:SAM dependent methyltransferase [Cenarchaeum symbiosum A]|uniref:SAM dependent methyltransferase n=1 Tax=Cenarchaeum symbiosum (strain A) TaxID=414004 RepID=A0RXQ3_CENSY|nr:SAM dependent methyltransferase [Cenarchaeum symbiosum A]
MDPQEYKMRTMKLWDEVAPRYHGRWAGPARGPFGATGRLVELAGIREGDRILDIACGTGIVAGRAAAAAGPQGSVVGVDISSGALSIARGRVGENVDLVRGDAEGAFLRGPFDAVTCQYALFYFPDAAAVLRSARRLLRIGGTLAASVHGHNAPFFTCILDAMRDSIPDYFPQDSPDLDRFGDRGALAAAAEEAGFGGIRTEVLTFLYSPGSFDEYWAGHLSYVAEESRSRILGLPAAELAALEEHVRKNVEPYEDGNTITFPWEVILLAATD